MNLFSRIYAVPENIIEVAWIQEKFWEVIPHGLIIETQQLIKAGWRFYIVSQKRGVCNYRHRYITIPHWVLGKDATEQIWYLAHEISHALAGPDAAHGPKFMEVLKRICPKDCIEHELSYKPRNAKAAGIGEITFDDI